MRLKPGTNFRSLKPGQLFDGLVGGFFKKFFFFNIGAFLVAQMVKCLAAVREWQV